MKRYRLTSGLHLLPVLLLMQLQLHHDVIHALPASSANLSTTWKNCCNTTTVVLQNSINDVVLACGFYCRYGIDDCFFVVFISGSPSELREPPEVIWSANRDRSVPLNAALQLTNDGDLVLEGADENPVWSTNTAGKGVVGMSLTEMGNLVLFDANNSVVWQSYDHPTNTLVSGQSLFKGQRLTAHASDSTWTRGLYSISSVSDWFGAFVGSNPPQLYLNISRYPDAFPNVTDRALTFFSHRSSSSSDPKGPSFQFLRLEYDGHIKLYGCVNSRCSVIADKTDQYLRGCDYPLVCGSYGICEVILCDCPSSYNPVNKFPLDRDCNPVDPVSCESSQHQQLIPIGSVGSFIYKGHAPSYPNITTEKECVEACLNNCSCKAALFHSDSYSYNSSSGSCFLQQEVFSFIAYQDSSRAYIKVRVIPSKTSRILIVGATVGSVVGLLLITGCAVAIYRTVVKEEGYSQPHGTLTQFSYKDMISATDNFDENNKLGRGGYGTVFKGKLKGTEVAIKKLTAKVNKEFTAEVKSIGEIHHIHVVALLGFCAEGAHRLLVYELMSKGSLDKYIFENTEELSWDVFQKIIHQVAKGLVYLHEDCRKKIAHLDIKPANILLDSDFNAKVSDFGLAKMIDREKSTTSTEWRGTKRYMAPEWHMDPRPGINVKADVYSFGVTVVEIVCGRKNEGCLRQTIGDKARDNKLLDGVDRIKRDVERDGNGLEKMLKLAIWCMQRDPSQRPAMSDVVKVLDGTKEIPSQLDYNL